MKIKVLIVFACFCIATIYGYTLGIPVDSLEVDETLRQKRQTCNNCVVGPPSGYGSSGSRGYQPYQGYQGRNYNSRGYSSGYPSYNGYSGSNGGYNSGYNPGGSTGGGGCRCVGNTCYNCGVGK